MTIDIAALDALPETEPVPLRDLEGQGMLPCRGITCWTTCIVTCFWTDW